MGSFRFEHSSSGYVALMKSGAMRSVLHTYADEIEGTASEMLSEDKGTKFELDPYASFDFTGNDRAGVRVQTHNPHASYAERKHGILQAAAGV